VVNYQGPKSIRRFVEALEIPIFNRVNEISYEVTNLSEIQLRKEQVARLHELEQILVSRRGVKPFDESEIKAAEEIVPACRLASVEKTKNQISIKLNPGSQLACCAP
jgi:hypothetical protein